MAKPMDMNPLFDSGFYPMPGRELPEVTVVESLTGMTHEQELALRGTEFEVILELLECARVATNNATLTTLALEDCYATSIEVDIADSEVGDFITAELTPQGEEEHGFIPPTGEGLLGEGP